MNAVPFDTLKLAQSLEAAGLAPPVAAGTATALAEAMANSDFATKADLALLESRLIRRLDSSDARHDARFDALESTMNARFATQEAAMKSGFEAQETATNARFATQEATMNARFAMQEAAMKSGFDAQAAAMSAGLAAQQAGNMAMARSFDAKLELLRRDMTIKLGAMMFVAVGVILTAMRFMPHP